jgi:hypothetical protein
MNVRLVLRILSVWIGLSAPAFAGNLDRYRYVLEKSANDKVCRHIQKVYNMRFSYPFKRPPLTTLGADPEYGPNGHYAFSKFPGVTHDNRMTLTMSLSRLPSSPEFEAIQWREGRYRLTGLGGRQDHGDQPMLVAEFDIDNDGAVDTVIKDRFMREYDGSLSRGGEDALFVFEKGAIDFTQSVMSDMFYSHQAGRKAPVLILGPYWSRLIRPFLFEGVTYLSTYEQVWGGGESRSFGTKLEGEYVNVLQYRGGGEKLASSGWSELQVDLVCRVRMNIVMQR